MSKSANRPAFPVTAGAQVYADGMTLRDWFAGQALTGLIGRAWQDANGDIPDNIFSVWAESSYSIADAVIAAREASVSLIDQICKDREAGATQFWSAKKTSCQDIHKERWALVWDEAPGGRKNSDGTTTFSLRVPILLATEYLDNAETTMTALADALNLEEANASRIARVPDMEAALLAAEELAILADECAQWMSTREKEIPGIPRLTDKTREALTAYRRATGEE